MTLTLHRLIVTDVNILLVFWRMKRFMNINKYYSAYRFFFFLYTSNYVRKVVKYVLLTDDKKCARAVM